MWVEILATDQRLDEKKIFLVQRKDFSRIHPDVHWCTLTWQEVECMDYVAYASLCIPLHPSQRNVQDLLINQILTVHA